MALTPEDSRVLEFLAEHRVVTVSQVQAALGCAPRTAESRVRNLMKTGLLVRQRIFDGQPAACWITRRGLGALETSLPPPRLDLKGYRHDVGVAWLWLAAEKGAFGRLEAQVSERAMRSADRRGGGSLGSVALAQSNDRYGVGMAAAGPRGGLALHYPDLLLQTASGHRVAVELELTGKGVRRLGGIMLGYAADSRVDAVLYLCPPGGIGRQVQAAARRAGISDRVHVQLLAPGSPAGAPVPGRAADRRTSRRPPAPSRRPRAVER